MKTARRRQRLDETPADLFNPPTDFTYMLHEQESFTDERLQQAWEMVAFPRAELSDSDRIAKLRAEYAKTEELLKSGMPGTPDAGKKSMAVAYAGRARVVRAVLAWKGVQV